MEDWPEFRSVWKDMLASYPDSIQVQHIKNNMPAGDARRVAGVKTMEEIWRRLEKVYGDTQLNILTIKSNLENLVPKAAENYKRVLEVFEAVETAVTQLNNLEALHYVRDNFGLISKLVMKLPEEYQDQYTEYITLDTVYQDNISTKWDKFWVARHVLGFTTRLFMGLGWPSATKPSWSWPRSPPRALCMMAWRGSLTSISRCCWRFRLS